MKAISFFEGFVLGSVLFIALLLHTRGFPLSDEGWILQAGSRLAQGEVVYKDFQFVYHPGVAYLNAIAFKLLGISVLTSRLVAVINTVIGSVVLYKLSQRNRFTHFLQLLLLGLYIFWGAGHINFVWPVMLCLTTGVISVYFWSNYFETKKLEDLFWVGVFAGLTLVFKQNFGVAIILSNCIFLLLLQQPNKLQLFGKMFLGLLAVGCIQASYFFVTGSFTAYYNDMRFLLFERILLGGAFRSILPWQYPAPVLHQFLKIFLYTLPFFISVLAGVVAWYKNNKTLLYYSILSVSYYGLSIRPTTDYVHLTPLLAFASFPLIYFCSQLKKQLQKISNFFLLTLFIFGIYSSLFQNYYRWDPPLITQNYFNSNPQILISSDTSTTLEVQEILQFFTKNAPHEKYLFTYSFASTFNVLTLKNNPTRFDYLHTGVLSSATEAEVTADLQNKNVQYILTDVDVTLEKDLIAQFIIKNYLPVKRSGNYTIWKKI